MTLGGGGWRLKLETVSPVAGMENHSGKRDCFCACPLSMLPDPQLVAHSGPGFNGENTVQKCWQTRVKTPTYPAGLTAEVGSERNILKYACGSTV